MKRLEIRNHRRTVESVSSNGKKVLHDSILKRETYELFQKQHKHKNRYVNSIFSTNILTLAHSFKAHIIFLTFIIDIRNKRDTRYTGCQRKQKTKERGNLTTLRVKLTTSKIFFSNKRVPDKSIFYHLTEIYLKPKRAKPTSTFLTQVNSLKTQSLIKYQTHTKNIYIYI